MKTLLLPLVLVSLSCADARDLFRPYAPNHPDVQAILSLPLPKGPVDLAIVPGCPTAPDGTPSMCQRCRVKTAVRQYRAGYAKNLLFSGAAAHGAYVEADSMAELAIKRKVPREVILRDPDAFTTWQNLRFALKLARERGYKTFLFISTSDHLPRVRRIAQYYGVTDAQAGYKACDLDMPRDSEEEWSKPWPVVETPTQTVEPPDGGADAQPPTKTNG